MPTDDVLDFGENDRLELAVEFDSLGRSVGVEYEELHQDIIDQPFDPEKIDVVTRTPTVDLLLSRIRRGVLDLQPDFQRLAGIWTERNQSRLIESMLLRIPLPTFYAAEARNDNWIIVDGVQRLTTIARFIEPESIEAPPLALRELEYLRQYERKRFKELPGRLQTRLLETELVLHLIRQGTPEPVMFNIFARINTGGRPLTRQELRHALIPGVARDLLRDLAASPAFQSATLGSVSPARMDDREMVLRFIAFWLTDPYDYRPEFDDFLREAMHAINNLNEKELWQIEDAFTRAMKSAAIIFGPFAFRKYYPDMRRRGPINKALFEAVSVNLAHCPEDDISRLSAHRDDVLHLFAQRLTLDQDFERAISVGTGDVAKVRTRFSIIDDLLTEACGA